MLELLANRLQCLTAGQEVGRQCCLLGLERDPARRLPLGNAGQGGGECSVQGAQQIVRVALEVVDVGVLVRNHEDALSGSLQGPVTA